MARLDAVSFNESLADKLARGTSDGVSLYWLGQAGFVIDTHGMRLVIDPYLSDSLATKYRGTAYSHERMAPAPLTQDQLGHVDLVLCTHHHTDHMDGETLQRLALRLPDVKFAVPSASVELAGQRIGVDIKRLLTLDAGQHLEFGGIGIDVLRAAHETLDQDQRGRHRFLGYGLTLGNLRIFHSGDTIPFEGQENDIRAFGPDIALFPVNGRNETLKQAGFAGNLTLNEATSLCERCDIGHLIAHHYGMFAFNTISATEIDATAETTTFRLERARYQVEFRVEAA